MDVKTIGFENVRFLPPRPGACQVCAVEHDPAWPHNKDSLYYQMTFHQKHGRFPTWGDAMAHCGEDMKALWKEALTKRGYAPEELEPGAQ